MLSEERRREIIDSLRRGTVPQRGLDVLAVGLDRFTRTVDDDLAAAARGGSLFKAVRGEYGCGKTFFARWFQEHAKSRGFACAEVQISETETPLHKLETVYRRAIERLSTADELLGAFRSVIDAWFFALEEDILAEGTLDPQDTHALLAKTNDLMERKLVEVTRAAPSFSAVLRAYRQALAQEDHATAEGLIAWLAGQPHISAKIKRVAGIKGDLDHFGAMNFLQGLLLILRDAGYAGLVLVLDEVETLQRVRRDARERALNALRQLVDEIDNGRYPGLALIITGTTAFFEGPQGVQRLPPLAQRLAVDFDTDARFDNPRAVQIRLPGFDLDKLEQVGRRVRDIFVQGTEDPQRIHSHVDDALIRDLARGVAGSFGGKVGIAPRVFLKKLVSDILDRVDQYPDFDPRAHYTLTLKENELSETERNARAASDIDEIDLDL